MKHIDHPGPLNFVEGLTCFVNDLVPTYCGQDVKPEEITGEPEDSDCQSCCEGYWEFLSGLPDGSG